MSTKLTDTIKNDLYKFFIVAFDAAPGATYMSQLADAVEADMTIEQIVEVFTTKPEFTSVYPNFFTNAQFANKLINTVVGTAASADAIAKAKTDVEAALNSGFTRAQVIHKIFGNLSSADLASEYAGVAKQLENQIAVAKYVTEELLDTTTNLTSLRAVIANVTDTTDVSTTAALAAVVAGSAPAPVDQTFTLTTGADNIPGLVGSANSTGTDGNDTIVATASTLSALDNLNGGLGTDELRITGVDANGAAAAINTAGVAGLVVTGVETVTGIGAAAVTIDSTKFTGVTTLKTTASTTATLTAGDATAVSVAGATGAVTVTGGASQTVTAGTTVTVSGSKGAISVSGATDAITVDGGSTVTVSDATADKNITVGDTTESTGSVTVTDTKQGTGVITVDGGTNVTITASGNKDTGATEGNITVGGSAAATGTVSVTSTGAAYDPAGNLQMGDISVTGGTTITVTQAATSDASKAATDTSRQTHTQGKVDVVANTKTTTVTVTQTAAAAGANAANTTGGATTADSFKFTDLTAGQSVTMAGLTVAAKATMTAAEVAAAFANLAAGAAQPTGANGDTQSAAVFTKATYSGSINGWTTGAASGDTVVFTSTSANAVAASITPAVGGGATAPTPTSVSVGKANDATPAGGSPVVVAGEVNVTGGAALATVNVDGYGAGSEVIGGTNTALATVSLANGGNFDIASAAATLALNLTKVIGTVDVKAGTTTLNASVNGNTATTQSTLKSATATTVNVSGSGHVAGTTAAGNLAAATAINTSGMTAGSATFTIDSGIVTTYTGGAAADSVTVSNAGTAITKAIDLGAGNDTLTLTGSPVAIPTATLKGGDGTDTLVMSTASADALDGDKNFSAKLDSFERLKLNTESGGAVAIDLANLGFTNYVTTGGSNGGVLTLNNLANNGTVVLFDPAATAQAGVTVNVKDAATGTADVLNVVVLNNGAAGSATVGTLTAANVETVNIAVDDDDNGAVADSHTMTLAAVDATKVTIANADAGDKTNFTLTMTTSTKVATVDASALAGKLTLDLTAHNGVAVTVTGGSGNDVLSATVGTNAKADVLNGGAGNDTLVAGTNSATLTGGAGNDIFVLTASSATNGNKEANTYSVVTDFQAGDLLQLGAFYDADGAGVTLLDAQQAVASFAKLAATLQPTATFSNYVTAAMEQMKTTTAGVAGDAVWFTFGGNSYVVVDNGTETTGAFVNGEDLVIQLTGVDLTNASFNSTYGTVSL